jgi:hypothetical protein
VFPRIEAIISLKRFGLYNGDTMFSVREELNV